MKCYIYFIINKNNNMRYVGQTTNFSRRKSEHLLKLKENLHNNKISLPSNGNNHNPFCYFPLF